MTSEVAAQLSPDDCIEPGEFVDSSHPDVVRYTNDVLAAAELGAEAAPRARAVALFLSVRDGIRYDPYNTSYEPQAFRASSIASTDRNGVCPSPSC